MNIKPIGLKEANTYIEQYHRHHKPVRGCKFCIAAVENGVTVGVAICGRPVSRYLDNGETIEINRCCTDGTRNACSKLYGACVRIAREMGGVPQEMKKRYVYEIKKRRPERTR